MFMSHFQSNIREGQKLELIRHVLDTAEDVMMPPGEKFTFERMVDGVCHLVHSQTQKPIYTKYENLFHAFKFDQ